MFHVKKHTYIYIYMYVCTHTYLLVHLFIVFVECINSNNQTHRITQTNRGAGRCHDSFVLNATKLTYSSFGKNFRQFSAAWEQCLNMASSFNLHPNGHRSKSTSRSKSCVPPPIRHIYFQNKKYYEKVKCISNFIYIYIYIY